MAAAARGEAYEIGYGGTVQYDFAPDVGRTFALASRAAAEGAQVANFPGSAASMAEVVAAIEAAAPAVVGKITFVDEELPFPQTLETALLERLVGLLPRTSLTDGVRRTIEHFASRTG